MEKYFFCFKRLTALCLLAVFCQRSSGQIHISGPECIVGNMVYQYNITGIKDTASPFQLHISGGKIDSLDTDYLVGNRIPSEVKIKWFDSLPSYGIITLETSGDKSTLHVKITTFLNAGNIDSASIIQSVRLNQLPLTVRCSNASGGSCNPQYNYQWQQSEDGTKWKDIVGATGQFLEFQAPISHAMHYRRRVREETSKTVAFSDAALIIRLK